MNATGPIRGAAEIYTRVLADAFKVLKDAEKVKPTDPTALDELRQARLIVLADLKGGRTAAELALRKTILGE